MIVTIPIEDVARLLRENRHTFTSEILGEPCLSLSPPASIYTTLALVADSTLYPAYRDRYFLCRASPEAMFSVGGVPADLSELWSALLDSVARDWSWQIVGALTAWTIGQFHQSERIFAWPEKPLGLHADYLPTCYANLETTLGSDRGSEVWRELLGRARPDRALVLNPRDELFPILMAALFLFASREFYEFCFTGDDGKQAFVMHHHDKIVMSIPDDVNRHQLLTALQSNLDLFIDASGYVTGNEDGSQSAD